ncbi:MAG: protein kinase [Acidobacteria bacterium]|nr:protein kinase [Acidobacteriota bacterium]
MKYGRYEIIRDLGKGAMGVVYLAKDPVIGRLVALKTLRAAAHADEEDVKEFQERFVREAQAAGILTHPNIVSVYDIGTAEDGGSFIAMEYMEGRNLKEILAQGRPLSHTDVARVMMQIAEALDFAHERGIIHRDVKPANIIIRDNNVAKITDFGIAKIATSVANLTMTGQFLGTPNYMAPEQVKGGKVDGRSDIFSLGVCLYEALTRQKPFGGDSLTTISYKIVHEEYTPPSNVDSRIPESFDGVVERCLAKRPEDRYQRASLIAEDLRALVSGKAAPARTSEDENVFDDDTIMSDASAAATVEMETPEEAAEDDGRKTTAPRMRKKARELIPPVFREKIPPALFWSIVAGILAAIAITVGAITLQRVDVPPVDTARENLVQKQRKLQTEAEELLRGGNVDGAWEKYFELRQLAPNSREVAKRLRDLETIRATRLSYEQRLSQARIEFESGREFYESGDYAKAIPHFEAAFSLDPEMAAAVNYLQLTQDRLNRQVEQARNREAPPPSGSAVGSGSANGTEGQATLLTLFNSPVSDGYLVVSVDGETIVHENLYTESWGFLKRRSPREVAAYAQVDRRIREIEVWIVVESMGIQERRSIEPPTLAAGEVHRLIISFDPGTRRMDVELS